MRYDVSKLSTPRTDVLYDLYDIDLSKADLSLVLYDPAHATDWSPYNLHDLAPCFL